MSNHQALKHSTAARRLIGIPTLAICGILAGACHQNKQPTTPRPESRAAPPPRQPEPASTEIPESERRRVDDTSIKVAVEQRFVADVVAAHDIDVTVEEGVVTLSGTVEDLNAKWRVTELAQAIKGVRSVVNRVEVKPVLREDDEVKTDIEQAFEKDPVAEKLDLEVSVEGGVVTLTGEVSSFERKRLAERLAASVRGVAEIKNQIDITYTEKRDDSDIKTDIRYRLRTDIRLDSSLIDVNVTEGKVRLTGTVGSAAEKTQAYLDSWVPGVESVSTRDLEVQWKLRDKMRRERIPVKGDAAIRKAVKKAFTYDPRVELFDLDVTVNAGVVTLEGVVDNLKAKRAAEKDAANTVGVVDVRNLLKVRLPEPVEDKELLADVEQALKRHVSLSRYDITPSVRNGKVYLEGIVPTAFDKELAGETVAGVTGVKAVGNNLVVNSPKQQKADWKILSKLNERLFWHSRLDSYQIKATVDGGVVALEGVVDSWKERVIAEVEAFEAGAWRVRNHLKIKPKWVEKQQEAREAGPPPDSTRMPPRPELREKK